MDESTDNTVFKDLSIEIFKLVSKGATRKQWGEWLRVPLEHAARKGDIDLVNILLRSGADASAGWRGGCDGGTLLGAGAAGGSEEVVSALLKAGGNGDVNVPLPGYTNACALHVAVALDAEGVARALLLAGADVHAIDNLMRTPLHLAAEYGHHHQAANLLSQGARLDTKDARGMTPLHLAVEIGYPEIVSVLLEGGASIDLRDGRWRMPLFTAIKGNHLEVAHMLLIAGADPNYREYPHCWSLLDTAARNRQLDMVRLLVSYGGDVMGASESGRTVLFHAVIGERPSYDNASMISYLIEAGADTEARLLEHFTPLLGAATPNHRFCLANFRALLEGGADVNARSTQGTTTLMRACKSREVEVVELLLRWGADETLTTSDGRTAKGELLTSWLDTSDPLATSIWFMLARAPADRSWRRRGWLVLCRYCPGRVSLTSETSAAADSVKDRGRGDGSAKVARTEREGDDSVAGEGGHGEGAMDISMAELRSVVARVVRLRAGGIFRNVVGYL